MRSGLRQGRAVIADGALVHAALGSMSFGFCMWDDAFRVLAVNPSYLELYHLPRDRDYSGMTLRQMAELNFTLCRHDGMPADAIHEMYLRRFVDVPGGKVAEHRADGRSIRTTINRVPGVGWVTTHQDISAEAEARRLAGAREQALAQQNIRFDAAVNNMPHGLAMFDAASCLVICNNAYAALYDLPPEMVRPGTPLSAILQHRVMQGQVPDGETAAGYVKGRLQQAAEQSRTVRFLERERGRTLSIITQPMPDGGFLVTFQDITEQRQKEDLIQARTLELEVQNVRFDAAINNMLHGLTMFDADNRLIVCNRQYAEMYGLPQNLTRPGTSFWEMLNDGAKTGMVSIKDPRTRVKILGAVIEAARPFKDNVKMENGRVIAILHQPMAGGGWISTHEDVTEQHHHEERIRHLARHDALTDLPNRVLFREEMELIETRLRRQEHIAVLCVDLDHFKAVNDTFGHAVGDDVLIAVAKRLREAARDTDIVARLGGDEFAILVGALDDPRYAATVAERVVKSLARPILIDETPVIVGASVGIAMAPVDGTDPETLLKNADLALYRAKADGRGTYHFFERGMDDALRVRRSIEQGLKSALTHGEFRLVFQPRMSLGDNSICGVETLLRWDHPERGLLAPDEFISIAEETGAIVAIGEWVVREACRAAARWPVDISVSINVAAVQLKDARFGACVEAVLTETGLAPERLELETSEAVQLSGAAAAAGMLRRLESLGVRLTMDNFGTGYASINHLRALPFAKLRIDQSLIAELSANGDARIAVNAMISLGRSLGLRTSAAGVETEEQLNALRTMGCEEVQGFLFSPPLPASGIDALLGTVRANNARRQHAAHQ
jgi:diguanylate cyclase (GGDEF)-like protein